MGENITNELPTQQEQMLETQLTLARLVVLGRKDMHRWLRIPKIDTTSLYLAEQDYNLSRRIYSIITTEEPLDRFVTNRDIASFLGHNDLRDYIRELDDNVLLRDSIHTGVQAEEVILNQQRDEVYKDAEKLSVETGITPEELIPLLEVGRIMAMRNFKAESNDFQQYLSVNSVRYTRRKLRSDDLLSGTPDGPWLTPKEREIYAKWKDQRMTFQEISDETKLSNHQIHSLIKRAKIRIKNHGQNETRDSRRYAINQLVFERDELKLIIESTGLDWDELFDKELIETVDVEMVGGEDALFVQHLLHRLKTAHAKQK